MKDTGIVRWEFTGDVQLAQAYAGFARKMLGSLHTQNVLKLDDQRAHATVPGATIDVGISFGQKWARINAISGGEKQGACYGFIAQPENTDYGQFFEDGVFCWNERKTSWKWKESNSFLNGLRYGRVVWHNTTNALSFEATTRYTATNLSSNVYLDGKLLAEAPGTVLGVCRLGNYLVCVCGAKRTEIVVYYKPWSVRPSTVDWETASFSGTNFTEDQEIMQPVLFSDSGTKGIATVFDYAEITTITDEDVYYDYDYEDQDHRRIFKIFDLALLYDEDGVYATGAFRTGQTGLGITENKGESGDCVRTTSPSYDTNCTSSIEGNYEGWRYFPTDNKWEQTVQGHPEKICNNPIEIVIDWETTPPYTTNCFETDPEKAGSLRIFSYAAYTDTTISTTTNSTFVTYGSWIAEEMTDSREVTLRADFVAETPVYAKLKFVTFRKNTDGSCIASYSSTSTATQDYHWDACPIPTTEYACSSSKTLLSGLGSIPAYYVNNNLNGSYNGSRLQTSDYTAFVTVQLTVNTATIDVLELDVAQTYTETDTYNKTVTTTETLGYLSCGADYTEDSEASDPTSGLQIYQWGFSSTAIVRYIAGYDIRCGAILYTENTITNTQAKTSKTKLRLPTGTTVEVFTANTSYLPGLFYLPPFGSDTTIIGTHPGISDCVPYGIDCTSGSREEVDSAYENRYEYILRRGVAQNYTMDELTTGSLGYNLGSGFFYNGAIYVFEANEDINDRWMVSAAVITPYYGSGSYNYLQNAPGNDPAPLSATTGDTPYYKPISVMGRNYF